MYRVLKNAMTIGGKVRMAGDTISDTEALVKGVYDWYQETKGVKRGEQVLEFVPETTEVIIEEIKSTEVPVEIVTKVVEPKTIEPVKAKWVEELKKKGYVYEDVKGLSWGDKVKKLGVKLAKEVHNYDKSDNS